MNKPANRRDDDVDDFMAAVLSGKTSPPAHTQPKRSILSRQPSPTPVRQPAKSNGTSTRKRMPRRIFKAAGMLLILALVVGGALLLWRGPISSFLEPKSPFSQEMQEDMGIPLYFPIVLPGSFKIETDSISQPEGNVVLYAITDDEGKRINMTLQKQPEGISLDPLYAVLSDLEELDTKQFGKIKTGVSSEGAQITNIMSGQTWVIINYSQGTIDNTQLLELINSFKEV